MKKFIRIGVDLGKRYFQVHCLESERGRSISRKLKRSKMLEFFSQLERCRVGMEACGSAHYWARELIAMGYEVVLIPPAYIKPYVKRGKNDAVDAAAICEAMSRPDMRFVPIKSADQQAVLMLHKTREMLVKQRTMSVNALRGHLAEFGIVVAKGIGRVDELLALAQADAALPQVAKSAVADLAQHLDGLDQSIEAVEDEIAKAHGQNPTSRLLDEVPGIGTLIASVIAASVPDPGVFKSGRNFAAWLGLTPRQNSSGRHGEGRRHHKTGQPLYPQNSRHRVNLGVARGGQAQRRSRRLDQRAAGQEARAGGGRRVSQQAGQDLLGHHDHRRKLPRRDVRESLRRKPHLSRAFKPEVRRFKFGKHEGVMNDTVATESKDNPLSRHEPKSSPE